jgi:twinkle protein
MATVIQPDEIDFAAYLKETEAQQKVKPANLYIEEMLDALFSPKQGDGCFLPWDKTHQSFKFRPGEVTLWPGINGHGKSLITGQVSLSMMGQGQKVCIASFEMKPRKTLERMSRQWSGQEPARMYDDPIIIDGYKDVCRQFGKWTDSKLWLYDQQGTVASETIVSVVRYCAKELGIQQIFVDSLMKCVKGEDDYNGQKYIIDEFCSIAKDHDAHIHVIHHIKKLSSEDQLPGKFDAKGSGSITDQVDNVLIHWRNKRKEADARAGKMVSADEPDALLICEKQRNGEDEPRVQLWYDKKTQQFMCGPHDVPVTFDEWPHRSWS